MKLVWSELLSIVNSPSSYIDETHQRNRRTSNNDFENTLESCEMYLTRVLTNPLSLKQLARIEIRNRIIGNIKNHHFVNKYVLSDQRYQLSAIELNCQKLSVSDVTAISTQNRRIQQTSSILECLIWQLDIPRILQLYLYAFPDIPCMPEDITVFVNE